MKIAIIQGSPIFVYNNLYYDFNLSEFDKYLMHCDHLIYVATSKIIDENKVRDMYAIDSSKVSFIIIERDYVLDFVFLSQSKRKAISAAIINADLVIVKMPSITIGKYAVKYLRKINKPYIIEVCGCAWDSFWYHSIRGKLLAPLNYLLTRRIVSEADNVIYVTNEFLQKRYPNLNNNIGCSNVLLPKVDDDILDYRLNKIRNSKQTDNLKIGTAGAVDVRYKCQEVVIKALALLKQKGVIVDYYLAGGGSVYFLESLAQRCGVLDHVHFLGTIPRAQMCEFYDMLDLYVHPSLAEGLPRVLIEAESRALPAIGANVAGIPELLTKDCIFGKNDEKALCDLILSFTKIRLEEQSITNFNRAKLYSFDILNDRRRTFYKKVLNKL